MENDPPLRTWEPYSMEVIEKYRKMVAENWIQSPFVEQMFETMATTLNTPQNYYEIYIINESIFTMEGRI